MLGGIAKEMIVFSHVQLCFSVLVLIFCPRILLLRGFF